MTVFIHIVRLADSPAEQEVTEASTNTYGNEQPSVECHCNQHKEIAERDLNDVQERL